MTGHRWSGWPGAWCLDCGCEDPMEIALADGALDFDKEGNLIPPPEGFPVEDCPEPMSHNHDPYWKRQLDD